MLSPNSEIDEDILLYYNFDPKNHKKLKSFTDLAEYISKAAHSFILLTDKGYGCLKADGGINSFKSFNFPLSLFSNERGSVSEISDNMLDGHFLGNPLLPELPSVNFFAAVPLFNVECELLGYLTVQDENGNRLDQGQKSALLTLTDQLLTYLDDSSRKHINGDYGHFWLAKNMDQGVTICDLKGKVVWVNDAFSQLTGYTLQEIAGKRTVDTLSRRNTNMAAIYMARAKSHKQRTFTPGITGLPENGGTILVIDSQFLCSG